MIISLNVANMNAENHGIALVSHQFWVALQAAVDH